MSIRVLDLNPLKSGMVHVIVVIVGYDYRINDRNILDLTGYVCVSLGTKPAEGTAALAKNRIEENSESRRKLYIVTRMSKPSCTEYWGISGG